MPRYDYECKKCGVFEIMKPMSEAGKEEKCKCGSPVTRIYTAPEVSTGVTVPAGLWRNFDIDPVYIPNKKALINECARRGVACKGLDETVKYWEKRPVESNK